MNRVSESKKNQFALQNKFGLATEEKRQSMIIGMLADIADSLALLCDMYAIAHKIKLVDCIAEENNADSK